MEPLWLAVPGCVIWLAVLVLPWRPWSTRPSFDAVPQHGTVLLDDVTVVIPARNEAAGIARTLGSLAAQGRGLRVVLVDDQSTDGTADAARQCDIADLDIIPGAALPGGWTGKLWALEQGLREVRTPLVLQLDADIELAPGTIAGLRARMLGHDLALVSLMARLRMQGMWECLLMPAFVYFFRLLYPFRLANSRSPWVAAAAGGCILIRADVLRAMGGFAALRGALIDDCTLARRVKDMGHTTWLGMTRSAISHREYPDLRSIWDMVARTAYTQLRHSPSLLLVCTALMAAAFVFPIAALGADGATRTLGATALALMALSYLPTLRYYELPLPLVATLPVAGVLFLFMTWSSACRHWLGSGARWKGRDYPDVNAG